MSAANIAYLVLVLAAYAAFIVVLGVVWLSAYRAARKAPRPQTRVTAAHQPRVAAVGEPPRRKAA